MKNLFLIALLHCCTNLAALTVDEFQYMQQKSIRELKELGLVSPDVLEAMSEVEVVSSKSFNKPNGATRWSAFADSSNKKIYLNEKSSKSEETPRAFVIHELFSAAGVQDLDYQHSVIASLLIENEKTNFYSGALLKKFQKQLIKLKLNEIQENAESILPNADDINESNRHFEIHTATGSWTIVGTGGDILSTIVKERMLRRLLIEFPSQKTYQAIFSRAWIFGLKIERYLSPERRPHLRALARFNSHAKNFEYLILAPTSFSIDEIEKDLWYFMIHENYRKNPTALYDILIPHTAAERIRAYRSRRINGNK